MHRISSARVWVLFLGLGGMACGSGSASSTRPGVDTASLIVRSNGVEIGYLVSADAFVLTILEPTNGILFTVNDTTGYVAQRSVVFFATRECGGEAFASGLDENGQFHFGTCATGGRSSSVPRAGATPRRRVAIGVGGDFYGTRSPEQVIVTSGDYGNVGVAGLRGTSDDGVCRGTSGGETCALRCAPTPLVPTRFALPITLERPGAHRDGGPTL